MNVDDVRVGGYQLLMLLLLSVNFVIVGMSHALSIFYKHKPDFHCEDDDVLNGTSICTRSSCTFDDANRTSVASDWLLICDREPLLRASGDVYFGGMLLGAIVAGLLMDRIGRLPVLAICLYAQGAMAVALNIAKYYELFLAFRGLQGFFAQGLESSSYVLGIELFPSKHRALVSLLVLSMRSVGFAALAGLNYAVLDWRVLQLVVSLPTTLTVLYIWLIPESARWLLARGRTSHAETAIRRIDGYNSLLGSGGAAPQQPAGRARAATDDRGAEEASPGEADNLLERTGERPRLDLAANAAERAGSEAASGPPGDAAGVRTADEIASLDAPNDLLASAETLSTEVAGSKHGDGRGSGSWIARFLEARFLGRSCAVLVCSWFACSLAFHGLISLPPRMKLDRHASLAIAAAMEIVTFSLGYALISSRLGRRAPLCVSQIIAAVVCLVMAILAATLSEPTAESIAHGKVALLKIGAIANIICFFVLRMLTIELFPTISRGTVLGLCIAAEMFGGLVTPLILMLNNCLTEMKLDISRIAIGIFCICVAFFTLTLQETANLCTLPDTVEDAKISSQKGNMNCNIEETEDEQSEDPEKLRKKLFSEDWVDAGNGIIVNFTENKTMD
ncbi:solute carrier family 22 member 15-like [Phymastichus coffea]|uniref:solute carrier family 22 member 15-like n=1 Tax=Phymastichus coffea TaxID=108790 RepID=UPI00273C5292|nr:solute carrier family 22 member 15-like [Phymastichus coffea]